eukprot:CAMPEP_0176403780 /NCGR_PEP_ID=MMETSP0126-20121128/50369_1 /TAXON_ID=141414 ORGANISM="Strombidinopsis acuminatum, Strain SPMC142" /NCGR_SAMPLE_ID=MMETSP0126 /ASSEMBLY_ACC=CAM_ASM_000229 /LENGTH=78 /DNA_ID=CAMNT_0017782237 /DNA_START=201 /DNA_END=438 /DNA_ORIENTATION=-
MTNLQLTMINIDMQQAFIAIEEEENAVKDSEETGEDEDDGSRVAIYSVSVNNRALCLVEVCQQSESFLCESDNLDSDA